MRRRGPDRSRSAVAMLLAGAAIWLTACNGGDTVSSSTPADVATATAALAVQRGMTACSTRRQPGDDLPPVKGYRLAAVEPLPEGIVPTVKNVRVAGSGASRVLTAEICFQADAMAQPGRHEAKLELRLYNADAERLSFNGRLQPVRTLAFSQVIEVR